MEQFVSVSFVGWGEHMGHTFGIIRQLSVQFVVDLFVLFVIKTVDQLIREEPHLSLHLDDGLTRRHFLQGLQTEAHTLVVTIIILIS